MRKLTIVACLVLMCTARAALAWNQTGHMTVALIAWRELSDAQKQQVAELLKAHPHYTKLLLEHKPENVDESEWAFIRAAVWPDMVRPARPGIDIYRGPEVTRYNQPSWHYIDFPYDARSGTSGPATKPVESATKPSENILTAIDGSMRKLSNPQTKTEDRAIALAWLEHLVGDIHQPLHAASLYSSTYPQGDRGGNDQTIRAGGAPMRLHAYWDDAMGISDGYELVDFLATRLMVQPMPQSVKARIAESDPKVWAQESHDLAVAVAYLNGTLRTAKSSDYDGKRITADQVPALPPGYESTARQVSEQRMVMAGLRLAAKLKSVLKP
jgi:hypothetical protein